MWLNQELKKDINTELSMQYGKNASSHCPNRHQHTPAVVGSMRRQCLHLLRQRENPSCVHKFNEYAKNHWLEKQNLLRRWLWLWHTKCGHVKVSLGGKVKSEQINERGQQGVNYRG